MCAHRSIAADEHLASIRQIHSLRKIEIEAAMAELRRSPLGWEVDQHEDCDGDVMLILASSETSATTFVLSGTARGIQLAVAEEDLYEALGSFETVAAAIQDLRVRTEAGTGWSTSNLVCAPTRQGDGTGEDQARLAAVAGQVGDPRRGGTVASVTM